jgi:hypothetical protein
MSVKSPAVPAMASILVAATVNAFAPQSPTYTKHALRVGFAATFRYFHPPSGMAEPKLMAAASWLEEEHRLSDLCDKLCARLAVILFLEACLVAALQLS